MANPLLQRQTELIQFLTSRAAIFGDDSCHGGAPGGLDPDLLRVEAWFSHEKRLAKIRGVFAKTFAILGPAADELTKAFAAHCPPASTGRLANARQFYGFLCNRWRNPAHHAYLRDVASVELARAEAAAAADGDRNREVSQKSGVRRAAGVQLVRCGYDIRLLFASDAPAASPARRDMPLAIVVWPHLDRPQVLELMPAVFELLLLLDDFVDLAAFGGDPEMLQLIEQLGKLGLVETRSCG